MWSIIIISLSHSYLKHSQTISTNKNVRQWQLPTPIYARQLDHRSVFTVFTLPQVVSMNFVPTNGDLKNWTLLNYFIADIWDRLEWKGHSWKQSAGSFWNWNSEGRESKAFQDWEFFWIVTVSCHPSCNIHRFSASLGHVKIVKASQSPRWFPFSR